MLGVFGRLRTNFAALIENNANTNRAFAWKFGATIIGCYSHKFNMAIKDLILEHETMKEKVNVFIEKLFYSIPEALLREKVILSGKRCNTTR